MAARIRDVVWAESAQRALDDILTDIALESPAGAAKVLIRALDVADRLSTLSERGRFSTALETFRNGAAKTPRNCSHAG